MSCLVVRLVWYLRVNVCMWYTRGGTYVYVTVYAHSIQFIYINASIYFLNDGNQSWLYYRIYSSDVLYTVEPV